jgi:hypothetical protein
VNLDKEVTAGRFWRESSSVSEALLLRRHPCAPLVRNRDVAFGIMRISLQLFYYSFACRVCITKQITIRQI